MKILNLKTSRLMLLIFITSFIISCSKDTDLISEYIIHEENSLATSKQLIDDRYFISPNQHSTVLEVLNNDVLGSNTKVKITDTSTPDYGSVVINGNELIYTPNAELIKSNTETTSDSFTYTTEIIENDSQTSAEGNVTITLGTSASNQDQKNISSNISKWKTLFDSQTVDDERQIAQSLSGDGGDIYYLDVSPYVYMFQVTGEDSYMDFAAGLFQNVMQTANDANTRGDGFLGWKDSSNDVTNGVRVNDGTEVSLAEGRGMRTVARMLWVMSKSPTYLGKRQNQKIYEEMLAWFQKHVWNKWESRGLGHFYRSRTHMSSHWGQIAWFLNDITGNSKYKDVYDGWCSGFPEGSRKGASMRKQLREINISGKTAYVWNGKWGSMSGANDVSHANAEVELMVLGAEMGDYWTQEDMGALVNTFNELIFKSPSWDDAAYYVDGKGKEAALWDQGWVQLGRFSESLQKRLASAELLPTYYYYQKVRIANLAYNQAYLEQNLFYPEN